SHLVLMMELLGMMPRKVGHYISVFPFCLIVLDHFIRDLPIHLPYAHKYMSLRFKVLQVKLALKSFWSYTSWDQLMEYPHFLECVVPCSVRTRTNKVVACFSWKPFDRILNETYQIVDHCGVTFIAEQVGHHHPISVSHAEDEHFVYDISSKATINFVGNFLDTVFIIKRNDVLRNMSFYDAKVTPVALVLVLAYINAPETLQSKITLTDLLRAEHQQ
ncbi:hypothetical protein M8C21_008669, partial [Ambrosia artemisiifolia]